VNSTSLDTTLKQIQQFQADALDAKDQLALAAREAREATQKLKDRAAAYVRVQDRLHTYLCDALARASETLVVSSPTLAAKLNRQITELQEFIASRVRLEHIVDLNTDAAAD